MHSFSSGRPEAGRWNSEKRIQRLARYFADRFFDSPGRLFLIPVFLVLMNSLKGQFYISDAPFALPNSETFVGLRNYWNGIEKVDFFSAFGYSAFITLFSVAAIVLFTAMTAWYLVRAGTRAANGLYYLFCFQHDRSVSNGHVHHVEDGKPFAFG